MIIIIHYNEIGLKGGNRDWFEQKLVQNIRKKMKKNDFFNIEVRRIPGRILLKIENFKPNKQKEKIQESTKIVKNSKEVNRLNNIRQLLMEIFGIANFSFAEEIPQNIKSLKEECWKLLKNKSFKTFRITTQRSNKNFPMTSEEINREIGEYIFEKLEKRGLKSDVNLKNPEIECFIEIVNKTSFVFTEKIKGLNGMPVGTGGKALSMLSGGIDSPVASYYGLKRGVNIDFIHFHSLPYTSTASNEKVKALAEKLLKFQHNAKIFMVSFAKIQQEIVMNCPEKLRVIMYRRLMLQIAEKIAQEKKYLALYSGESVAQVASQTLENILATNDAVSMTILRPLCGFDKLEIIEIARKIDTYDISVLPHEDCCTRFIPKHPETRAKLEDVRNAEKKLDIEKIIKKAISEMEIIDIK